MSENNSYKVGAVLMSPVYLNKEATLERVIRNIARAKKEENCDLVVFGESLVPGYPIWLKVVIILMP